MWADEEEDDEAEGVLSEEDDPAVFDDVVPFPPCRPLYLK